MMDWATQIFSQQIYAPARDVAGLLRGRDRFVVTAHANPDGDALGSMAALGLGLAELGKAVALCNVSGAPEYLRWMPMPGQVHKSLTGLGFVPETAVVLDCGDAKRLGKLEDPVLALPSVNIDHHLENPLFGSLHNWTEPRMAATGQMVAAILHHMGVSLGGRVGEALYASLCSDTGGFAHDNTSEDVFLLAAHLVKEGVPVAQVRQRMDNQWDIRRMRLWGQLLQSFETTRQGSVAWCAVPLATLQSHGALKEDLEGFVEHMRRLRGTAVSVLLREDTPTRCKLSLRSTGPVDVRSMAAVFGGGGHHNAAGATLDMPLQQAAQRVLDVVKSWLDEHDK